MNCFNHHEISAIGICKHCNKGVCQDCYSDTGDGIACKGHCTEEVQSINKIIEFNKKAVKQTSGNWTANGLFFIVLGVMSLVLSVVYLKKIDPFFTGLGALFSAYGLYTILKGRSLKPDSE